MKAKRKSKQTLELHTLPANKIVLDFQRKPRFNLNFLCILELKKTAMRRTNQNIYNLLKNRNVLNTPMFDENAILNWGADWNNVKDHYESYLNHFTQEGAVGPIEKHPYIERYSKDFDLKRRFLLLGTMPPSSYFNHLFIQGIPNDNISDKIPIEYYYGNMQSLWRHLGFGNNLTVDVIRNTLNRKSIAVTDVLSYLQRKKLKSANDSDIHNIVLNKEIVRIFSIDSKIETILTTSGSLNDFHENANVLNTTLALKWILSGSDGNLEDFEISANSENEWHQLNNFGVEQVKIQQGNGIIWWIRKGEKKVRVISLPSPSGSASRKMGNSSFCRKWLDYKADNNNVPRKNENQKTKAYINQHPDIFEPTYTKQYRSDVYAKALDDTLHEI